MNRNKKPNIIVKVVFFFVLLIPFLLYLGRNYFIRDVESASIYFSSIDAGDHYTCGISNGQGYCWGSGLGGQLGNGDSLDSSTPVLISQGERPGGVTFSSISTNKTSSHTCGVGSNGQGYCWGYNNMGQLGNGTSGSGTSSNTPVLVSQGAMGSSVTFSSISAGAYYTCGVGSNGQGYCWGYNYYGQLGNSSNGSGTNSNTPVLVSQGARPAGVTFSSVSAGNQHTCGVGSNGQGYCWGLNYYGQLGNSSSGSGTNSNVPVLVNQGERPSGVTFSSISAGSSHTCGIGSNGQAYCWGRNNVGQLGNNKKGTDSNVPVLVLQGARPSGVTFSSISAGRNSTCGVGSNGQGYCWGSGATSGDVPVLVGQGVRPAGVTFTSISAGYEHSCGIGSDGHGYCWGNDLNGELGRGRPMQGSSTPVKVVLSQPDPPTDLATTYGNGKVSLRWNKPVDEGAFWITDYIIQYSSDGGSTWSTFNDGTSSSTFSTVTGLTNGTQYTFRVAAFSSGGTSAYSNTAQSTPQALTITSISSNSGTYLGGGEMTINATGLGDEYKFIKLVTGNTSSCGLTTENEIYCWGKNDKGQLGNGNTGTDSAAAVLVRQGQRLAGVTFRDVSDGYLNFCGIGSDGQGYCWGYNYYGQLGNGNTGTDSNVPVLVAQGARQAGVTFLSISARAAHACGIGSDGQAYCWGKNDKGQLGNGNTGTDSNVPVLVAQGARQQSEWDVRFTEISVGYEGHTCALGTDDNGYCWGYNGGGALGDGNIGVSSNVPVLVARGARQTGVTFKSITCGINHSCGLGSDGKGYCWGWNNGGQLGSGNTSNFSTPNLVLDGEKQSTVSFVSIVAGRAETCGVGSDGNGYCWGWNTYGQLGNGGSTHSSLPVLVLQGARPSADVTFTTVDVGSNQACGIGSDGKGYCWGLNNYSQLGDGTTSSVRTPVLVQYPSVYRYKINIGDNALTKSVAPGSTSITISPIPAHVVGTVPISLTRVNDNLSSNNVNYIYTNLATPDITNINPSVVSPNISSTFSIAGSGFLDYGPLDNLSSISGGYDNTCGLDSSGNAYCWGNNTYGQLGNGNTGTNSGTPVLVNQGARPANVTFTDISIGRYTVCGVGSNGMAYCWGYNDKGQLGNGNTGTDSNLPVLVSQGARPTNVTYTNISVGESFVCALGSDKNVYCWGWNAYGQLGNGNSGSGADTNLPVLVGQGARPAGVTFKSISVRGVHSCSLGSNNNAYCWGFNANGQLGNGNTGTNSNLPVLVSQGERPAGVTFSSISAGIRHNCALGSDNKAYCWGWNINGQIGDGLNVDVNTPTLVLQGAIPVGVTINSVITGARHSCIVGSDGKGYCWGHNNFGQLGDGSTINSNLPILVNHGALPAGVTFSYLVGGNYTCGKLSNNRFLCWGGNGSGQLGNNEIANRPTPSYVLKKENPTILFGITSATSTTYTSTTAMSAVSPVLSAGTIAVKLTNPDGQYDTYNIFAGNIPSAPLNLVSTYGDGKVSLGWNKPADEGGGVTDYIIQYSSDGGSNWSTFDDGTSTNTFTTVTGLTNGTQYTFRVAASNPAGTSTYSNTVQSTPQALAITSISPTNSTYLGGGNMTINVTGLGDTHKYVQISSGETHTCGISIDGNVYCWGSNTKGQLGNGNVGLDSNAPVLVNQETMPSGVTFNSISAGYLYTCGVGSDGNGYCWGYNDKGQLGNGNTGTDSNIPVLVSKGDRPDGITFTDIYVGYSHTCGVGSDGNGYCWGYNSVGQLGNSNTGTDSNTPVLVSKGERATGVTFVSISTFIEHTCGLGSDGQGYCWGGNWVGQLGNGKTGTNSNVPVLVSLGARSSEVTFTNVDVGWAHTCGLGSNGETYCWGWNSVGQLGNGQTSNSDVPALVSQGARPSGDVTFSSIDVGSGHTCGVGSDGNGYCWGQNDDGQLGNGTSGSSNNSNVPVLVSQGARPAGITFIKTSAGYGHTCGMGSDGNGYCWGRNNYGQLGNGRVMNSKIPVLSSSYQYTIAIGNNVLTQYITGGSTSIIISPIPAHVVGTVSVSLTRVHDNEVSNNVNYTYINLPTPDITNITPSAVLLSGGTSISLTGTDFLDYGPISNLTSVSAGNYHTCGVGSNGEGYCWGGNGYGQLGNGNTGIGSNVSVLISKGDMGSSVTFSSISAGGNHTCGVGSNSEGYCWGYNGDGQLGDGNTGTNSNEPVLVSQGARTQGVTFSSISAGYAHTCGVGSNGEGYCWGYNYNGQLGNNSSGSGANSDEPVLVSLGARTSGVTFSSISVGSYHTCGVGSNGQGYCWGSNYNGQLGNGTSGSDSDEPVLVNQGAKPGGVTFVSISAGGSHTCGVGSDGNGYCWGGNSYGQLGNNGVANSDEPVLVSQGARPGGVTFSSISAGYNHTCGVGSDGQGYCWGWNEYKQLGNGSTVNSNVPILVNQGAIPAGVTFSNISTGQYHVCGKLSNNRTLCWGYNNDGQLGTKDTLNRPTPGYVIMKKNPTIEFGTTSATSTTYTSTTAMSAVSPVLSTTGTLAVKLTNPDGQYDTYDITVQGPPTVPLNLSATAGNTQASLSWNAPSSDGGSSITDYIIQYSTDNSTWTTFDDGTSTNTTATVTGLTNGTLYYFRVAAVNSVGTGPYTTSSVTATPVNVAPTFTNITNTSPVSPGSSITWNATASDSDGQVKLLVCKTAGITGGVCDGGQWCSSSLVSSNPSCSYSVPNPTANGTYNAYVYIVDNQNEPATGLIQGSNSSFTVSSVAPGVTNVTLNGGNTITLVESTTKSVALTATVTSDNTCSSITSVKGYLYRSGVGYTGCDTLAEANDNYCYPEVSCTLNSGSCTEGTESSADYTCTVNVQYFADPTDTNTQYDSQNWLATVKATNSGSQSTSVEVTTGVEMNSLTAFSVTNTLSYGNLFVSQSNDPLDRILTTTATGNVGLNQEHQGSGTGMCTDYPTCEVGTPILLSNQKYSLSASTSYSSATSLTSTSTEVALKVPKPTSTTAVSKNTWWGAFIPLNTLPGYYEGQNVITAVKGAIANW